MDYDSIILQLISLSEADPWYVPLLSNASALLFDSMKDLNWAGFYLLRDGELVLGPFQGKPACIHIPVGRGVCGTAVSQNRTLRVSDVHAFPGHISCDCASNSEIVIPLSQNGTVFGVLDLDSPLLNRFGEADQIGLEQFAKVLCEVISF